MTQDDLSSVFPQLSLEQQDFANVDGSAVSDANDGVNGALQNNMDCHRDGSHCDEVFAKDNDNAVQMRGENHTVLTERRMAAQRIVTHRARRIGIMGGTFDPIHHGHLVAASEVASVYHLDEVIFVPTGNPVFKMDKKVTNAEDRYLMTVIATASNPRFTVSRVDIDRGGITYTIDTLRDLHALYPEAELFFITGADAVTEIMRWKDADKMWDLAHFIAVTRPGYHADIHRKLQGKVDLLEIPALAISSTDIRHRATHGNPVWYLVPDGVVQYIAKHSLYR